MKFLKAAIIFAAGAAVGYFVAKKRVTDECNRIAEEEIQSVRDMYERSSHYILKNPPANSKKEGDSEKNPESKIMKKVDRENRTDYSGIYRKNPEKPLEELKDPYVISPEEFGAFDYYSTLTFKFWSNHIVTDENDDVVDPADVDDYIGLDSLNHFGEYEEDAIYVRNEKLRIDYEILLMYDPYQEE